MRVAVVGGGISGLVSAYVLAKAGVQVVLYEKEHCLGGHAKTVTCDAVDLDLGFMVFNRVSSSFSFLSFCKLHSTKMAEMNTQDNIQEGKKKKIKISKYYFL